MYQQQESTPAVQRQPGPGAAAPGMEPEAAGAGPALGGGADGPDGVDGVDGGARADSAAAASVLSHWAEAPVQRKGEGQEEKKPPEPTSLPAANTHVPQTEGHKAEVVPLTFTGLTRDAQGGAARKGTPQTVRVILDRFEELHSEFLSPGKVNVLGGPETVKVVPGDSIEIYTWNNNEAAAAAAVGFVADQKGAFTDLRAEKASGAANSGTVISPPQAEGNAFFGMEIRPRTMGGVCFRAKIADLNGGKPYELTLTQACKQAGKAAKGEARHEANAENEDISTGRKDQIEALRAQKPKRTAEEDKQIVADVRKNNTRGFHEQGSFYGDLVATEVVQLGTGVRDIAAPGSTAYGGKINRAQNVGDRAAAYWVPITVQIQPEPGIKHIRILPNESAESYPGEAAVGLHAVAQDGTVVASGVLKDKGKTLTIPAAQGTEEHRRKFGLMTDVPVGKDHKPLPITLTLRFQGASATRITLQGIKD